MNPIKIKKYLIILIKVIWVLYAFYITFMWLTADSHSLLGNKAEYLGDLLIITFPFGIIVGIPIGFILGSILKIFRVDSYSFIGYFVFTIIHYIIILAGYYQWFVIVPKIINKIKKKDTLKEIEKNEQIKEDVEKYKKEKEEYIKNLIIRGFNNNQIKEKVSNFTDDDINKIRDILFNQ